MTDTVKYVIIYIKIVINYMYCNISEAYKKMIKKRDYWEAQKLKVRT